MPVLIRGQRGHSYVSLLRNPAQVMASGVLALTFWFCCLTPAALAQTSVHQGQTSALIDPHDWLGPLSEVAAERLDVAAERNDCWITVYIVDSRVGSPQPSPADSRVASIALDISTGVISVEDYPTCFSTCLLAEKIGAERPENQSTPTPESLNAAFDMWVAPTGAPTPQTTFSPSSDIIVSDNSTPLVVVALLALGIVLGWLFFRHKSTK